MPTPEEALIYIKINIKWHNCFVDYRVCQHDRETNQQLGLYAAVPVRFHSHFSSNPTYSIFGRTVVSTNIYLLKTMIILLISKKKNILHLQTFLPEYMNKRLNPFDNKPSQSIPID